MLAVSLRNSATAALAALPDRIRDALAAKAGTLAAELQTKIQQKLAGGVLNMKSGALARSILVAIDDASANVSARVATSNVKYAAIHEFGGTIPPHQIVPDKARALAFVAGGKQVFAARVQIPTVTMPERSYMRSSLAEMESKIVEEMTTAVTDPMQ